MTSLLFHISYYSNSKETFENKNIKKILKEINLYTSFKKKVIIFDINSENKDIEKINFKDYPTLDINIEKHYFKEEHTFRLTTKHRFNMKKEIENFDWFGYSENNTIITNKTMKYIVENLNSFYKKERKVFSIPQMVYNKKSEKFYSDIIELSPLRKKYISPKKYFGACWIYSKEIMKDWIECHSFLNFSVQDSNEEIKVKMGSGFLEKVALIPINIDKKEPFIGFFNLGYS